MLVRKLSVVDKKYTVIVSLAVGSAKDPEQHWAASSTGDMTCDIQMSPNIHDFFKGNLQISVTTEMLYLYKRYLHFHTKKGKG